MQLVHHMINEHKEILKNIPHLKLDIEVNVQSCISELDNVPELIGYQLPSRNDYKDVWKGRGLIDYEPDSTKGMMDARSFKGQPSPFRFKYNDDGDALLFETELHLPNMYDTIYKIFKRPDRCRISQISAGGSLFWHSHCRFHSGNYEDVSEYNMAIIHIPLITNPRTKFGVTKFPNQIHGINPIWQHYEVGEVWLLNSWHEHNAINEGETDRIHIMAYGQLDDEYLSPHLETAVNNYSGEFIDV